MSTFAITQVWPLQLLPAQKLVLLALADYADERGRCFPGQAKLAERACIDARSVRRHIAALEKNNFIEVERTRDPATNRWRVNRYLLRFLSEEPRPPRAREPEDTKSYGAGGHPEDTHRTPVSAEPSGVTLQGSEDTPRYAARACAEDQSPQTREEWQQTLIALGMPEGVAVNPNNPSVFDKWVRKGVTPREVQEALRVARFRIPDGTIYPAYLDPIIEQAREKVVQTTHAL